MPRDRLLIVWVLLVTVTLLSSAIGSTGGGGYIGNPAAVTVTVLSIAFFKLWMVMFHFMEVRGAPVLLRAACTGWAIIVPGVLLALYFGVLR